MAPDGVRAVASIARTGLIAALVIGVMLAGSSCTRAPEGHTDPTASQADELAALRSGIAWLERRLPTPELGQQMLELQLRHDGLWWAGHAGNWNLAYYMVSELGESLGAIAKTNGEAPELQPEKLSEVMPAIMDPAIARMQAALAKHDAVEFAQSYDGLSAACNACHAAAGVDFLHIQRPRTPLLDNLRYEPPTSGQ